MVRRRRRGRTGVVAAAVVAGALALTPTVAAAGGTFVDDDGNVHEPAIEVLAQQGITAGCTADGTHFCPTAAVTRAQMAAFVVRTMTVLGLEVPAAADRFTDLRGSVHREAIERLAAAGVVHGYADGRFAPDHPVSRGQMALFLHRAFWFPSVLASRFGDVPAVYGEAVDAIADAGVTLGCTPDGSSYCPDAPVARDQMASFLVRTLEAVARAPIPGVTVSSDGALLQHGRPLRAIGVNYFDAFYRHVKDPGDTSFVAGLAVLAEAGVPFVRFSAGGYWPSEQRLYLDDPGEFFRRFDRVVRAAEMYGVGLVPSLFWHPATPPDLVGEPVSAWGDPASRTHAYLRSYVRDVVTRYRRSPAIWGWEFGNEYALSADLPNAAEHRFPVWPELGTPATRSEADDLSYEMIRTAFTAFGHEVRRHDQYRFVTSGNALPRESAWHNWQEGSWTADSPDQFAVMLLGDNPDPLDVVSIHAYPEWTDRISGAATVAAGAGKPIFIGEFGAPTRAGEDVAGRFAANLQAVEASGASLAALWVYDLDQQPEYNVTPANDRAWQFEAIVEANERVAAEAASARR